MWDFLTFRSFITPDLLIILYYMGAVVMPLFAYLFYLWLRAKFSMDYEIDIRKRYRYLFYLAMIISFLSMEIFWRMLFEFMIAYFDMHDALLHIASEANIGRDR